MEYQNSYNTKNEAEQAANQLIKDMGFGWSASMKSRTTLHLVELSEQYTFEISKNMSQGQITLWFENGGFQAKIDMGQLLLDTPLILQANYPEPKPYDAIVSVIKHADKTLTDVLSLAKYKRTILKKELDKILEKEICH